MSITNIKKQALLDILALPSTVGRKASEIADEVGYTEGSMKNVIAEFRKLSYLTIRSAGGAFTQIELSDLGRSHLSNSAAAPAPTNENSTVPLNTVATASAAKAPNSASVSETFVKLIGDASMTVAVKKLTVENVLEAVSKAVLRAGGQTGTFTVYDPSSAVNGRTLMELTLDSVLPNGLSISFKNTSAAKRKPLSGGH